MLELKKLSSNDGKEVYDMLQGIQKEENGFTNEVKDMPYENFSHWLKRNDDISNSVDLPDGWVPQTTFWLYCDNNPVGIGRIRHYLNDSLKEHGGHIGYAISSSYRGNGYGNEILRLLLIECKKMGIGEVHIDPYKSNESSTKIVIRNGGKLQRETVSKNYFVVTIS